MIRNCLICGKEISTCPSWNTRYCSRACSAKSMMRRKSIICSYCNKSFMIPLSSNQRYCSRECSDADRRGKLLAPQITKVCPVCGNQFNINHKTIQTFCSRQCAYKGKSYPIPNVTLEERARRSQVMHNNMVNNPEFRARIIDRMKNNNPTTNPEVVAKIKQKMQGKYVNNFKYGNGKISLYEQKVYDRLAPLGFVYNYAISTKLARQKFPAMNYANNYKPDFVNLTLKLCIEIDGTNHLQSAQQELDKKKESCLKFLGYSVIRFTHTDIDEGRFDEWLNSFQGSP